MANKEKFVCYCADWRFKNAHFVVYEVRKNVCRGLPSYGEIDGKQYCVLHYPSKGKVDDFEKVYQQRAKDDNWDFRMVYFPNRIEREKQEFSINADFAHATFAEIVSFKHCKFIGRFDFFDAKFLEDAYFTLSNFHGGVNFNSVEFLERGDFAGVTFHKTSHPSFNRTKFNKGSFCDAKFHNEAKFPQVTFSEYASFRRTKFFSKAIFEGVKFPENRETEFRDAEFYDAANFENAEFFETDFSNTIFGHEERPLFSQVIFKHCKFNKSTSFTEAKFYVKADFTKATFQNIHFERATFANSARFTEATFTEDAFFSGTKFGYKDENRIMSSQVNFDGASFGDNSRAYFDNTWFSWHTNFDYTQFKGFVLFKGNADNQVFDRILEPHAFGSLLSIQNTTFERPEKVHFQSLRLRPSWFVNIVSDSRKFNFANIEWSDEEGNPITIEGELKNLGKRSKLDNKKLLAITFRQLAENAETSSRYEEASNFRRMAMEIEWLEKKEKLSNWITNLDVEAEKLKRRFSDIIFGNKIKDEDKENPPTNSFGILSRSGDFVIHALYRFTSFYGESWAWASGVLLLLIFAIFPLIYAETIFQTCPKEKPLAMSMAVCESEKEEIRKSCACSKRPLAIGEAITHSLTTATFQSTEYRKPISNWAELWTIAERIFAPLQAALLALALRRKFMR